jgi:hypothetical protein
MLGPALLLAAFAQGWQSSAPTHSTIIGFRSSVEVFNQAQEHQAAPTALHSPQISAGQMHSGCITHEGQALMWGSNRFWALGLPQALDYDLPTEVSTRGWSPSACQGCCTLRHAAGPCCVIGTAPRCQTDGLQSCCTVIQRQFHIGKYSPTCCILALALPAGRGAQTNGAGACALMQVPGLHGIAQLACGGLHSLALRHSGDVLAWGANQNGVLGLGAGRLSKQTSK